MGNKIRASMQKKASGSMKEPKKKMCDWRHNWWDCWDEFKFKHPWRACSLQYGCLALLVLLVVHILSGILSDMADVDYFRYPLSETLRHPFNATANLMINKSAEMHTIEIYAAEMYADNARSILCTLVASEAAIVAIVVSLTLIAIELTASAYSPRVIKISLKNPDMWFLLLIYGVAIFSSIILLKQLPYESRFPTEDVSLAFWLGVFSYVALVPYLWNIPQLLDPTNIVKRVSVDIEKDKLLKYINDLKETSKEDETNASEDLHQSTGDSAKETAMTNGDTEGHEENPIQPILDIIYRSINKYDLETVRNGLEQIEKLAEKVIDAYSQDNALGEDNDKLRKKQMRFSKHFCNPLRRISRLAASKDDEESTREVIKTLQTFGEKTADKQLKVATEQVAVALGAVGEISVEKGKAFEDAVNGVVESLEEVGKAAVDEEGLEQATEQVAVALGAVGITAAKKELEWAVKQVASSLKAVGIAAAERELGGATEQVISSLEAVGKAVAKKKLGVATEQVAVTLGALGNKAAKAGGKLTDAVLQAVFSLEAVGTTAAEKGKELEKATNHAALCIEVVGITAAKKREELENMTEQAATSLGSVGKAVAEAELENVAEQAATSLGSVGKAAAEAELEKVTEQVATYLGAIVKTAMENNLEGAITEATKSLLAVGTTILEKKRFENAIDEVVRYLNDSKTSNVNIFETIIHDYELKLKKLEERNTFQKFKNLWQD